ncbi:MAG: hypothetical protein ABGY24_15340, partial [bacterium]
MRELLEAALGGAWVVAGAASAFGPSCHRVSPPCSSLLVSLSSFLSPRFSLLVSLSSFLSPRFSLL